MRPTRRQALGLGALLLTTGCSGTPAPSPVDPDDALVAGAVAREELLLAAYDAALLAFPALAGRLVGVRAEHAEHLRALTGPPPTGSPAAAVPTPAGSPPAAAPPATAALALAALADAERLAAAGHATDSLDASRTLAYLLAALAASEHSHPAVLG